MAAAGVGQQVLGGHAGCTGSAVHMPRSRSSHSHLAPQPQQRPSIAGLITRWSHCDIHCRLKWCDTHHMHTSRTYICLVGLLSADRLQTRSRQAADTQQTGCRHTAAPVAGDGPRTQRTSVSRPRWRSSISRLRPVLSSFTACPALSSPSNSQCRLRRPSLTCRVIKRGIVVTGRVSRGLKP
jgi:hypothetical protein